MVEPKPELLRPDETVRICAAATKLPAKGVYLWGLVGHELRPVPQTVNLKANHVHMEGPDRLALAAESFYLSRQQGCISIALPEPIGRIRRRATNFAL
jgi:hypothetical protein